MKNAPGDEQRETPPQPRRLAHPARHPRSIPRHVLRSTAQRSEAVFHRPVTARAAGRREARPGPAAVPWSA